MFIYGKNNPVKYGDSAGYDAVILINDKGGIPHTGVLIEDENGDWYHFYWGAHTDVGLPSIVSGKYVKVSARLDKCNFEAVSNHATTLNLINSSGLYGYEYDDMVYLDGDFTESYDYYSKIVQEYNGKNQYCLYEQNCSQVSLYALSVSETLYSETLDELSQKIYPPSAFKVLKKFERKGSAFVPTMPIPIVQ